MHLADKPADSAARWQKLPPLNGMVRLGKPKPGCMLFAESADHVPILVGQDGVGRTLAFAGDTTVLWLTPDDQESHARFWQQVVLWLGKQEETENSAWIRPDARRIRAGSKLGFFMGLRGKTGLDAKDARFEAKVIEPNKSETVVPTNHDKNKERGVFWKTDQPGQYRLVVAGKGKDADGQPISGEMSAHFLVYQDEAEMARRAADHEFLKRLAAAGGGGFHSPEELVSLLQKFKEDRPRSRSGAAMWPNWKAAPRSYHAADQLSAALNSGILPGFVLFVVLLGLEWVLRRRWGMA